MLSEADARQVEAKVLPEAGSKTAARLREQLRRAVIAVDPEAAERRRADAERQAAVRLYPDEDGTATLTGTGLPAVLAAAAMAKLTAMARARKAAGMGGGLDLHRAQVMLGLLLDTLPPTPPAEGAPPDQPSSDTDPGGAGDLGPDDPGGNGPANSGPHDDGDPIGSDSDVSDPSDSDTGDDNPSDSDTGDSDTGDSDTGDSDPRDGGRADDGASCDSGSAPDAGGSAPDAGGPSDGDGRSPTDGGPSGDVPFPGDEDAPPDDGLDDAAPGDTVSGFGDEDDELSLTGPTPQWPELGAIPPALARPAAEPDGRPVPGLLDVTLPWTTLAGLPGGGPAILGRIGPITPLQARELKQDPRWKLEQTKPGTFTWTTPAGRTYTVVPDSHPL